MLAPGSDTAEFMSTTTLRDLGAMGIRLIGLYSASRVVVLYAGLMAMPLLLSAEAFTAGDPLIGTSVASGVGSLVVAVLALAGAQPIAARLFPATPLALGMTRGDALRVGIAVLGVWLTADALAALLRTAASYAYYTAQSIPAASLERSWPRVVADAVTLLTGLALALSSHTIAARLDR